MRCLDWRVLAGLGALALIAVVINPNWALPVLVIAAVLACPLSCWWLLRRGTDAACTAGQDDDRSPEAEREAEVARLRREVAELKRDAGDGLPGGSR
ncbi:hypothetical protein [Haloechinothrix sp. LS1_15]|uniref:hypothetical protein n=1 Tax=Haloechinothrix sp. LS1_15 TaxID=2652248 RepID=UPI002946FEF7|nr:hypothetical protein [Haloechinothrix sp. LS1_15]MDV6014288.1 sugar porter family MFS transporter [Haloechinothrix sp. LS1_15]